MTYNMPLRPSVLCESQPAADYLHYYGNLSRRLDPWDTSEPTQISKMRLFKFIRGLNMHKWHYFNREVFQWLEDYHLFCKLERLPKSGPRWENDPWDTKLPTTLTARWLLNCPWTENSTRKLCSELVTNTEN
jgi:hypothetical protein